MRVRGLAAAASLLALALVMTGCTKSAPKITDAQVEEWRALAAQTIPAATSIDIRADQVTTMAGNSNIVYITVMFADFTDLKADYQAVTDLDATVNEQVPRAAVSTTIVNDGIDALKAEVVALLLDGVPGLAGAKAGSNGAYGPGGDAPTLSVTVYVYVTDPAVIDPKWLDEVSTITQQVASDAGGRIYSIAILPDEAMDLQLSDADIEKALIPVAGLQAIKGAGVDNGCVRTDSWAYDVSNAWAVVYPANGPEGACA